jgi:hypothetical protein
MVREFEEQPPGAVTIIALSRRYTIKPRRLYDVINVFIAVGSCHRSGIDGFTWLGLSQSLIRLRELRDLRGIDNPNRSLFDLFPINSCVGIANLTIAFMLLFYGLRTDHLDVRIVATIFSRGTNRFRSTLCKLYQIAFVLSAAGIVTRTTTPCDVRLIGQWLDFTVVPPENHDESGPASLVILLNHKGPEAQFVHKRRKQMTEIFNANQPAKPANASEFDAVSD